jgi:hypothetical protein
VRATPGLVVSSPHPFRRIPRWLWAAFLGPLVGWSAWYMTSNARDAVEQHIADAKAWTITGPSCPRITKAEFLGNHHKGPRRFDFEGVAFFRRTGHAECAVIRDQGGRGNHRFQVCQFTSPDDLLIRASGRDWYFRPGPGQAATVSLATGQPACVLASHFSLRPAG